MTTNTRPFPSSSSSSDHLDTERTWPQYFQDKLSDKVVLRRYASLGGSILVALSAGSNYAFSSYAPQLSESLHLTATQLNIVGVLGNMGVYLSGPWWGKWVDKRGPKFALFAGAVLVSCGYGGLSLVYSHEGPKKSALAPALLNLCAGIGNNAAFTAAMNAQAKSFSGAQRGSATALVLAGFGLSAFMYSTLSHVLFPGNTSDYLLLLAFGSAASFLAGIGIIKITPTQETLASTAPEQESSRSRMASPPQRPVGRRRRISSSDLGALAYVTSAEARELEEEEEEEEDLEAAQEERRGLLNGQAGGQASKADSSGDGLPDNITGWKLLRQTDFRLLFAIMCLISGSGLLLINNVGTITKTLWQFNHGKGGLHGTELLPRGGLSDLSDAVAALQSIGSMAQLPGTSSEVPTAGSNSTSNPIYNALKKAVDDNAARLQQEQAHQVSAISIGNASGRILLGFLSDLWVAYLGSPRQRVWLMLPVTILAFSSQFLFALPETIDSVNRLLVASFLSGLMYGGLHGIAPCLTFEWFGLKHAARNWSLVALAPVISGNVFNLLFGRIFDSHVPKRATEHVCLQGEECYRSAFVLTSVATAGSVLLACVLIARRADGWPRRQPKKDQTAQ